MSISMACKVVFIVFINTRPSMCVFLPTWHRSARAGSSATRLPLAFSLNTTQPVRVTVRSADLNGEFMVLGLDRLIGPDFPSIETRQLGRGFQIGASGLSEWTTLIFSSGDYNSFNLPITVCVLLCGTSTVPFAFFDIFLENSNFFLRIFLTGCTVGHCHTSGSLTCVGHCQI